MANKVIIPKQGLQMTEGTINKWLFKQGDSVTEGQPLFEMETDKVSVEIDSPATGILLKIVREAGEIVPVSEMIAIIGDKGEDISGILAESNKETKANNISSTDSKGDVGVKSNDSIVGIVQTCRGERVFASPRAKFLAEENGIEIEDIVGTGPEGLVIERDVKSTIEILKDKLKITPVARKLAEINGVETLETTGSGIGGKVMKADILSAISERNNLSVSSRETIVPFIGMRKVISDNMMQSLHGMAQVNHKMKVNMTELIMLREKLKSDGIKVSFTDILVKIVAKALMDFPMINATLSEQGIVQRHYVNMGIAVAVNNGLIVPVIKNADLMDLEIISEISSDLISKAKSGGLKPADYKGGTFTLTNLGMFDIDEFTAIINPPEVGILAIGKIDRMPVAVGDTVVIKPMTMLNLTYDHRVIDGAPAAQFLQRIKQIIQNPYLLL